MKRKVRRGRKPEPEASRASAAGAAVLDPPALPETEAAARETSPDPGLSPALGPPPEDHLALIEVESHLVVLLGGALYAIPIAQIEQIIPMRPVAPLPRSAPAVLGVLFLRGQPVSVIDLARLLDLAASPPRRVVVLVIDNERYGLVVEDVLKVTPPGSLSDLCAPPATLVVHGAVRALARLGEEIISLLDPERLLPAVGSGRSGT